MKTDAYIKRLETVQTMAEDKGLQALCEILMDLLEEMNKNEMGFKS